MPICETSTCGSLGTYAAMLVADSDTTEPCDPAVFDSSSERFEILYESITYSDVLLGGNGLNGTLDKVGTHTRHGTRVVTGQIALEVGPHELKSWLPRILGNPASGNIYETDVEFDVMPFDIMMKRDAGVVIYRHCGVSAAMFSSRASIGGSEQVLRLVLTIVGYEEINATWPDPEPSLPTDPRLYWLIGDSQLLLTSDEQGATETEYFFDAFSLLIDNNLVPLTRNFLYATCLQSRGRDIKLRVSTPYTEESHLEMYINAFVGSGKINFLSSKSDETPAAYSTIFEFPELRSVRRTPHARGRGEIPLSLDLTAYRPANAEPIKITNVAE